MKMSRSLAVQFIGDNLISYSHNYSAHTLLTLIIQIIP